MRHAVRIDFKPADLLSIPVAEEVLAQRNGWDLMAFAERQKVQGPTVSMAIDGTVYACGFSVLWKGSATLWATIHRECPPGVCLEIREQIVEWMRDYDLQRMQSITPASWEKGRRFLEWVGMEYEGTLRKMGPGGVDQAIYARVN